MEERDRASVVFRRLLDEFGDRIDEETIRDVATEEVHAFTGARVGTFVPIIAWRKGRTRLRMHELERA